MPYGHYACVGSFCFSRLILTAPRPPARATAGHALSAVALLLLSGDVLLPLPSLGFLNRWRRVFCLGLSPSESGSCRVDNLTALPPPDLEVGVPSFRTLVSTRTETARLPEEAEELAKLTAEDRIEAASSIGGSSAHLRAENGPSSVDL